MSRIGKIVMDYAPGEESTGISIGDFVRLKDGRIMLFFSKHYGDFLEDDMPNHIYVRYSSDDGETWTKEDRLILRREFFHAKNLGIESVRRLNDGSIGLFLAIRMGLHDIKHHLIVSRDEGETWTDTEVECVPDKGYYGDTNDRVLRTHTGRLILPVYLNRTKGRKDYEALALTNDQRMDSDIQGHNIVEDLDMRGIGYFYYSDDDGKTWKEASDCCFPPTNKLKYGLTEPCVVELKNHILWVLYRTTEAVQYESFSFDDGDHWSDPVPSYFTSPDAPLNVKYLSDGRLMAVWNPIPLYNGYQHVNDGGYGGRVPLVAALSDGYNTRKWSKKYYLEDGSNQEDAGYCYPSIFPLEDSVLVGYCAGKREEGGSLARMRIRKIMMSELVTE